MPNEEFAVVLDYLPRGKSSSYKTEPIAQVLGTEFFSLLEVVPKKELKVLETIYIGKEERTDVSLIKRRIPFKELTATSEGELEKAIEKVVFDKEVRLVEFFNNARPITIKRHQLELLPGVGKKHVFQLLDERQKKPFESFLDIEKRVPLMPTVSKAIVKRILLELEDPTEKHFLFARPPPKETGFQRFGNRQ
ncbi:DUF655 domain-containing protein [Candidatus Micrarchaeota archaeon]|nr:DUF655 domain-containing protein [Candidatus Micrarchaeota archaeon]MBU1930640.1 DUF655 domain-containing protein [Candidatus Micrarchaeota archaeon]